MALAQLKNAAIVDISPLLPLKSTIDSTTNPATF
jgi:hypothetical protein